MARSSEPTTHADGASVTLLQKDEDSEQKTARGGNIILQVLSDMAQEIISLQRDILEQMRRNKSVG